MKLSSFIQNSTGYCFRVKPGYFKRIFPFHPKQDFKSYFRFIALKGLMIEEARFFTQFDIRDQRLSV